ncbi:hypothetical protein KCU95_g3802, partial [Aureobasidium melanogenum]
MRRRGPGVCYAFQRGECHRGSRCQYLHDPAAHNTRQGPKRDKHTTSPELDNWKDMAFQTSPLGFGLGKFFSQALRLIQLDDACRQEVIKSLATDKGLNKVLELVSQKFESMSEKTLVHIFVSQISPFFRVLSEEHVMSSPLLERHLGDICQFLYGVGGSRGEKLFATVIQALSALLQKSDIEFFTSLEASLAVLMKLVEFNSTAKVTPCFTTYATALAAMLTPQSDPAADNLRYQATKHLDNINKRLGIGTSIRNIGSVNGQDTSTASKPTFSLQRSLPGRLPNGRPRHNNDFDSIEKIQIMPTSEEIQSTHAEHLPLQDPSTWHKTGVTGLIDRHFRLLREDTIGQLRDSARIELEALQGMEPQRGKSTLRRHTYRNVLVELPKFDSFRGLEFVISFDQPPELRSKSKKQCQDWWTHSKRLEGDALICLISSTRAFVFCSVCFPHDQSKRFAKDKEQVPDLHRNIISHSDNRVRVIARPSEMNTESIAHILGIFSQKDFQGGRSLVEFPGVLLPAFLPTLTALKTVSRSGNLPFSDFLAPSQGSGESTVVVPPPAYAQRAGFRFKLDSIIQDETSAFDPTKFKQADIGSLQKASTLDNTQASALLSSLSRSFALIQGPPGTGKSYTGVALMKTLVNNKKAAALGPILVVTFTNHALDQSLEHLLDHGITQIVRLGSNSRSERMADINLRKVAATVERTKAENSEYGKTRGQMDDQTVTITRYLQSLSRDTQNVREYLAQNQPNYYAQIYGAGRDADGWEEERHGSVGQRFKKWLHGGKHVQSNRTLQVITRVANVNDLLNNERRLLHDYWLGRAQKRILDALNDRAKRFNTLKLRLDAIKNETDLRVLNQANVIGVTTSGLARNLELLRKLSSKILLCEEAGEVLESHLLTALLPSVEHAILIGDHLQLRPHVQCYNLSQESSRGQQHALDTSLFERLVTATDGGARLPFSRLDTQRRMHPNIAELVRTTLYPTLSDAPSTLEHPHVVGLKKRLFWLDHQHPETHSELQSTSHTNDYEVEITTALVSHLIKQGVHKPGAIAVLTPYVGQLKKLQLRMQSAFEVVLDDRDIKVLEDAGLQDASLEDAGLDDAAQSRAPPTPGVQKGSMASAVRIATVDNFQGEEADVVVISLVRSNDQQKCGFLRTSNQINVLLSRAKNGMYIIGNSNTTQHIPMWTEVLQLLQMNGNIGEVLELSCARHPDDIMEVSMPDDFVRLAPDGGCNLPSTSTCAEKNVAIHWRVVMFARSHATTARSGSIVKSTRPIMATAVNLVAVTSSTALTAAKRLVTMVPTVVFVTSHVKSGASILTAVGCALSHALRVQSRSVPLVALTRCTSTLNCGHQCPSICGAPCPSACFCQECANEDIKSRVVDLIMMSSYGEIDLDEDPCVFPACGHFYTIATMDGHLSLGEHYLLDAEGLPAALKAPEDGLDVDKTRIVCPDCRRSLRGVPRFGRVVRRALLIRSTLKFITWSNNYYIEYYGSFSKAQKVLQKSLEDARPAQTSLHLYGSRDQQIHTIRTTMSPSRYKEIVELRWKLNEFRGLVNKNEQPFKRVQALVRHARLNKRTEEDFTFDESVILQTRSCSLATSLLIRCDLVILSDVLAVRSSVALPVNVATTLDLNKNRKDCEILFQLADEGKHYLQQAEALIFWAHFAALEVSWRSSHEEESDGNDAITTLRTQARQRFEQARVFCAEHSQARTVASEIEEIEKMLRESTFYQPVSSDEMQKVVTAMTREFRGTGHWYRCRNGHPFTVGECGMPVQTARCPQCGEVVGGQHHRAAEGVTHAGDIERDFGNMRL